MDIQEKKLKLLIHQPRLSYYIGGGERVPLEQAEILSSFGHKVEILTSRMSPKSSIFRCFQQKNPKIKIHYLSLPQKEQKIYKEKPGRRWFRWDIESIVFGQKSLEFYSKNKTHYDAVITHLLSDSLFIPLSLNNILHLHGVPCGKRDIDNIFLRRPDGFIAVSKSVKTGWGKLYPALKKKNIKICYNGVDNKKFCNSKIKRNIDLLFVGRLLEIKGIYRVVEALKILIQQKIDFNKLVIVGQGPERLALKRKIKKLGLEKKIKFIESATDRTLINLYNQSRIFLCPSYKKEGVLTTMLEAASCGCAIISADCCGMKEFIKNNINGILAKPNNAFDLAQKIKLFLKDESIRNVYAQRAEKEIQKKWNILQTTKMLEKIYLKIIKKYDH